MPMEFNPTAAALAVKGLSTAVLGNDTSGGDGRITIKLTPRQARLTRLWGFFNTTLYDRHAIDWNGRPALDDLARMEAAAGGSMPFSATPGAETPLSLRRPAVTYPLGRLIVSRFTGLLFSQRRHPKLTWRGDPATAAWLKAAVESGRFWARMRRARDYGGGTGTAVVGFAFVDGRIEFEVLDPRWCDPRFADHTRRELASLEVRFVYTTPVRGSDGVSREAQFWFRRVIDATTDTVWARVPVGDGKREPEWANWRASTTEHGFGFVPFQWVQNAPVDDAVDGEPDCIGCFDAIEAIDRLLSQANRGVLAACDPTLTIATDDDIQGADRGSDNLLRIARGDNASYLELNGSGPKAAEDLANSLEARVLRTAQCVIEQSRSGGAPTATEISKDVSAMYERGDVLREQYGEECIRPLLDKLLRAARKAQAAGATFELPPRVERDPSGGERLVPQVLTDAPGVLELTWPDYERPSHNDRDVAQRAAAGAYNSGLLSLEDAVRFLAPYFDVEDHQAAVEAIKRAAAEQAAQDTGDAYGGEFSAEGRAEVAQAPVDDTTATATEPSAAELYAFDGAVEPPAPEVTFEDQEVPPPVEGAPAPDAVVQPLSSPASTAMNGAQVKSLIDTVASLAEGRLGRRAVARILMRGFAMAQEEAEDMLAEEVEGSRPPPTAPPSGGSFGLPGGPKGSAAPGE